MLEQNENETVVEAETSGWPVDQPRPRSMVVSELIAAASMILSGHAITALRILYTSEVLNLNVAYAQKVSIRKLANEMGIRGRTIAVSCLDELREARLFAYRVISYGSETRPAQRIEIRLLSEVELGLLLAAVTAED